MTLLKCLIWFLRLSIIIFFIYSSAQEDTGKDSESHPLIECETSKGSLVIEVIPQWSPLGAERFLELIDDNFYTNIALYRCVRRFLVQFGITDNQSKRHWHHQAIKDDPNLHLGIKKNYVSFAGGGPNTRTTQIFIAFEDLDFLGNEPWETPFGRVIKGQETLDHLYKGYGDIPPFGNGPDQSELFQEGNEYIHRMFPQVDFIHTCSRMAVSVKEEKEQEILEEAAAVVEGRSNPNNILNLMKKKEEEVLQPVLSEEEIQLPDSAKQTDNDDGQDPDKEEQENHLIPEEEAGLEFHQEDLHEGGENLVLLDEPHVPVEEKVSQNVHM